MFVIYVEIKCQLDATDEFLLRIVLLAQHVLDTIMPIIRSSSVLHKWFLPVVFGAWFSNFRCSVELRVVCPVCSTLHRQLENQAPNTTGRNHLCNTLELLMMGIMVSEACWANNKIYNKNSSVASSWHFISRYWSNLSAGSTARKTKQLVSNMDSNKVHLHCSRGCRQRKKI
jgi:hypothetical protein